MRMENDKIILTEEAIAIFGDIVEEAYVLKPSWDNQVESKNVSATNQKIEPRDGYPVFVKFKNGKTFDIRSSEWGGVYATTEDDYAKEMQF
jgi:hypothetical protein